MKIRYIPLLFILAVMSAFPCRAEESVYAFDFSEETVENKDMFSDELKKFFDSLPEDSKKNLPEGLAGDTSDIVESAEKFDADYFVDTALEAVRNALFTGMGEASRLLGVVILASVFGVLRSSVGSSPLTSVFTLCTGLCIALTVYDTQIGLTEAALELVDRMASIMNGMLPVMAAVHVAGGNITAAAVNETGIMLIITAVQNLFSSFVIPVTRICFCMSLAACVTGSVNLAPVSSFIRKLGCGILVFIMTVLSFALTVQTTLASSADTVSAKTVKFAAGSIIPVVGGAISEAVNTLSASVSLIKNAAGIAAIGILAVTVLPTLATLTVNKLLLSLCSGTASAMGCEKECSMIGEISGVCTFLIAAVCSAAVLFILALALFVKTGIALGS